MIDLKHEIERELSLFEPPDLWNRIQADAAKVGDAPVVDLAIARRRRTASRWLAAVATVAVVALVGALTWPDDDQNVVTVPADTESTGSTTDTTPEAPIWSGPVRAPSDVVHRMTTAEYEETWDDPLDTSEPWADLVLVRSRDANQGYWMLELAAMAPSFDELEPGVIVAYGLVFDTNADGAADYVVGIDNDAPVRGNPRAWVTDLATGETDEQTAQPYGYPIEFGLPSVDDPYPVFLTFLNGSAPANLDPETVRFYAWTSATRDGQVFAHDFAPDTGWIVR